MAIIAVGEEVDAALPPRAAGAGAPGYGSGRPRGRANGGVYYRMLGTARVVIASRTDTTDLNRHPKELALLAYLALGTPIGATASRDVLLRVFWPDADERSGRHALRQALYAIRSVIGPRALTGYGSGGAGVRQGVFGCDVWDVEEALRGDDLEAALQAYGGELLPGLHPPGCAWEFEEWLEETRRGIRERLGRRAKEQALALGPGRADEALHWARTAATLMPFDEEVLRFVLRLLLGQGRESEARLEYGRFARRLERELDLEPSAQTRALILPR